MSEFEFTCDICGVTFEKVWSDEESLAESESIFGFVPPPEERGQVCDGCWPRFLAWAQSKGLTVRAMSYPYAQGEQTIWEWALGWDNFWLDFGADPVTARTFPGWSLRCAHLADDKHPLATLCGLRWEDWQDPTIPSDKEIGWDELPYGVKVEVRRTDEQREVKPGDRIEQCPACLKAACS